MSGVSETATDQSRSPVMVAGALFALILAGLALIDAKKPGTRLLVPSLAQLGRAAELFHGPLPYLARLAVLPMAVVAWSSVVVLWVIYLRLIWRLRSSQISLRWVVGGAVGLSLLAVCIPPLFSTDIFSYAMFGRLAGVYDLNPYLTTARNAAPADPLMPYLYWRDIATPYGPIWSLVSWIVTHGASATPFVLVVRFKLVALASVLLNGALIYHLVRLRWPDQATWAYLAFAWNPLVLIDGVVAGHNDMLILTLVLLSVLLMLRARRVWSIVGLFTSSLIKYSTAPLVGVALLQELVRRPARQRGYFLIRVGALAIPLGVIVFLPFWAGPRSLTSTLKEPGRGVTNPLWRIVQWTSASVLHGSSPLNNPMVVTVLAMTIFGVWQLVTFWRQREHWRESLIHDDLAIWAQTLFVFLLVWPRLHTWYVLVPMGLALAAGPQHKRTYVQVLILTALSYLAYV